MALFTAVLDSDFRLCPKFSCSVSDFLETLSVFLLWNENVHGYLEFDSVIFNAVTAVQD